MTHIHYSNITHGRPDFARQLGAPLVRRQSDVWVHAMCHIVCRLFLIFILIGWRWGVGCGGGAGSFGKGAAPLQLICECETRPFVRGPFDDHLLRLCRLKVANVAQLAHVCFSPQVCESSSSRCPTEICNLVKVNARVPAPSVTHRGSF